MADSTTTLGRSFAIGAISGLRTMSGPAIVRAADRNAGATIFAVLALGEMIVDKLPMTPNRTRPFGLIARAIAGAYAGSVIARDGDADRRIGAVLGAMGSVLGAFVGFELRKRAGAATHIPDALIALVEDAFTVAVGSTIRG